MRKWLLPLLIVVALASLTALYLFFKEPADIRNERADFELTAAELLQNYSDEKKGDSMYVGKVIAVTGKIAGIEDSPENPAIFLDTGDPLTAITCTFYTEEAASLKTLKAGETVTIKGECTGKLADIILNHCSIVK